VGIFIGGEALAEFLNAASSGLSLFQPSALILATNQIISAAICIYRITYNFLFFFRHCCRGKGQRKLIFSCALISKKILKNSSDFLGKILQDYRPHWEDMH
jgi:hypothetical protein